MSGAKKPTYAKNAVTSKDGTSIGFRQLGDGPGVVILHGGALASQHYMKLSAALADEFTVYVPDRRGRGMSGPYGPHYCIEREDEDLDAIIATAAPSNASITAHRPTRHD
jgi:pimeloyl-ACP methyl ester carboxylesterase